MSFSDIFIRRPVLSTVLACMILLLGFQAIFNLSIRQYPKVDETAITITTAYPGASADLIQGFISAPIARAVASTENIDYVTSSSRPSSSTVTVQMKLGSNPDVALTEVLSKVQGVRGTLPDAAKDPVIVKGTGQQFAMMYISMQNPNMTKEQLTEYIERVVRPRISTVEGVADVQIFGAEEYSMRVWIDPVRLAARGATAADVLTAINNSNFLSAPGNTQNEYVVSSIAVHSTLQTPEAFAQLPIRSTDGQVVRLRDVARVELGAASTDTRVSFNGKPGTFLAIFPTPAANPLTTAEAIHKIVPVIQDTLPKGMTIEIVYDSTEQISASIEEVFKTIGEAVAIVILVILLFLGSFRSVMMPIVTIPLSLIGVCFILFAVGYSINLLSLLAMVLAIGLVVDDAIVVVENIHRHMEEDGMSPMQAAFNGMREIFSAIVAMTITLAAVFAPLAFTGGLTGALFREFAVTLAGSVVLSGLIAVTITPMMSARLLKAGAHGRFQRIVDGTFSRVERLYERAVTASLRNRPVTFIIVVALVALTGFMFTKTSTELAPEEDQGFLLSIVTAPRYATSDYTETYVNQILGLVKDIPETRAQFSAVAFGGATNGAFVGFAFKDWAERQRSSKEIQADITGRLAKVAGVEAFVFAPPTLPGSGGGLPISMVVRSTGDPSEVFDQAEKIKNKAQASGRFIVVQNSMSYDAPQVTVTIDRERAAALNLPIADIGNTLTLLVGGAEVAQFDRDSNSYDIIPQVPQEFRDNPAKLGEYFVRSVDGKMVPLSAVVHISTNASPAAIEQFNQLNSATISALPLPGVTTGDGLKVLEDLARETLPDTFFIDYSGQSRQEKEQGNTILIAFAAAVIVIYLVLAAQFESFRDPLIIMMAVPLSIFGAIVPLNIGLGTLNIYTQVGLITLIGLITKHGILLVEFANQQREIHGMRRRDAIIASAKVRLRPILMTTAAMALGVVPLIISSGAGAAARYSMGLVIFTGILVGTMFTLFVVPMFYTFIASKDLPHLAEKPDPKLMPALPT
ncbi:efflux RND transporter permease subunit [Mesorhizobium sp. M1A.F.Ca.IN.020.30.1.1]|uniref:efflux RND transporter permease subunit n=7 Tax=Mesorhizobium TaxID=68287 RepID=UPI000BAF81BB|nr:MULTISPECIES: efflux RND transporter permease subunit [unclassified Mesorhizobium]TGV85985.1 efflux RND transporter permease subunit [Mesorhizobium sp. M00.F.Ca.ET.158.01.1.1]AZO60952.1 efflux RND transporter permease subunit [Mesorhizobium sp. M1A.F.Ca.IN.022.06.1.1]MCT2576657.1 efflux RND transporter permease subunit [Mesorhizobium sp. P13.3]MDF3165595.1 efflux RND transporter permease subunit [Mesorhizobium sp. P16.1]MDF3176205.1 efflux RND transporter permease subunit [Mesorhizobium sp.